MSVDDDIDSLFGSSVTALPLQTQRTSKSPPTNNEPADHRNTNVKTQGPNKHVKQPSLNQAKALALLAGDDVSVHGGSNAVTRSRPATAQSSVKQHSDTLPANTLSVSNRTTSTQSTRRIDTAPLNSGAASQPVPTSVSVENAATAKKRGGMNWSALLGINSTATAEAIVPAVTPPAPTAQPPRIAGHAASAAAGSGAHNTSATDVWSALGDPLNDADTDVAASSDEPRVGNGASLDAVSHTDAPRQRRWLTGNAPAGAIQSILPKQTLSTASEMPTTTSNGAPHTVSTPFIAESSTTPLRPFAQPSLPVPSSAAEPHPVASSQLTEQLSAAAHHQDLQRIRTELHLASVQHTHMEARFRDTVQSMQQRIDALSASRDTDIQAAMQKQQEWHRAEIQHIQQLHQQQIAHLTQQHTHDLKQQSVQYESMVSSLKQQLHDASLLKSLVNQFDQSRQSLDVLQQKIQTQHADADTVSQQQWTARAALLAGSEQRVAEQMQQCAQWRQTVELMQQEYMKDKETLKQEQARWHVEVEDVRAQQRAMQQQLSCEQQTLHHSQAVLSRQQAEWTERRAMEQAELEKQHQAVQQQQTHIQQAQQQLQVDGEEFAAYVQQRTEVLLQREQEIAQRLRGVEERERQLQYDVAQYTEQCGALRQRVQHSATTLQRIETKTAELRALAETIQRNKAQACKAAAAAKQLAASVEAEKRTMQYERLELEQLRQDVQQQYTALHTQQQVCQQEIRLYSTVKNNQITTTTRRPSLVPMQSSTMPTMMQTGARHDGMAPVDGQTVLEGGGRASHHMILQQLAASATDIHVWMQSQNLVHTATVPAHQLSGITSGTSLASLTNNDSAIELQTFHKVSGDVSSLASVQDMSHDLSVVG